MILQIPNILSSGALADIVCKLDQAAGTGDKLAEKRVSDPLQAHVEQLSRYTDADMHDVLAYLQTLR